MKIVENTRLIRPRIFTNTNVLNFPSKFQYSFLTKYAAMFEVKRKKSGEYNHYRPPAKYVTAFVLGGALGGTEEVPNEDPTHGVHSCVTGNGANQY